MYLLPAILEIPLDVSPSCKTPQKPSSLASLFTAMSVLGTQPFALKWICREVTNCFSLPGSHGLCHVVGMPVISTCSVLPSFSIAFTRRVLLSKSLYSGTSDLRDFQSTRCNWCFINHADLSEIAGTLIPLKFVGKSLWVWCNCWS